MIKKLILLFTVFMIVFIAYLIYSKATSSTTAPIAKDQFTTGQNYKTAKPSEALITTNGTGIISAKDIRFVSINEKTGKTDQIFALKNRDTSSTKHATIIDPWIKQYDHENKKIMTFRADRLIASIESGQSIPKEGILEGNVQIHLFHFDQDKPIDRFIPKNVEMKIGTSKIEYLQEFNKITAPKQVKITSPSFSAQGNYFTIKYDGNQKIIEHFEFRSIDYFTFSSDTSKAVKNKGVDKNENTNKNTNKNIEGTTKPLFYRMTLSDDVKISQSQTSQTVHADKISLLIDRNFKFKSDTYKQKKESQPKKKNIKGQEKEQETHTTTLMCNGPLNVTVLKDAEVTPEMSPLSFEITGKPNIFVTQKNLKIASLPKITYALLNKTNGKATIHSPANFLINSGKLNNDESIKIVLLDQDIDLNINHYLKSNQIASVDFIGNIDLSSGKSTGDIDLRNSFIKTTQLTSNKGTFKFADADTMPIQSIELFNQVEINNNDIINSQNPFDFKADSVKVLFESENGKQQMSAFTARGNVFYEDPNVIIESDDFLEVVILETPPPIRHRDKALTKSIDHTKTRFKATTQSKANNLRIKVKDQNKTITGNYLTGDTISNIWHIDGKPAYVIDHNNNNNQIAYEQLSFEIDNTNTALNIDKINIDGPGTIAMQLENSNDNDVPTTILANWLDHVTYQSKPFESMEMQDATIERTTQDKETKTERKLSIASPIITMSTADTAYDKVSITKPKNEIFDFEIDKISTSGGEVLIESKNKSVVDNVLIDAFELASQRIVFSATERNLVSKGPGNYLYFNYHPNFNKKTNGNTPITDNNKPFSANIYFEDRMIYDQNKSEVCFEGDIKLLYTLLDFTSGFELFADALIVTTDTDDITDKNQASEVSATNVFFRFKKGKTTHNIHSEKFTFNIKTGFAVFSGKKRGVRLDGNRYAKIEITDIASKTFKAYPLGTHEYSK